MQPIETPHMHCERMRQCWPAWPNAIDFADACNRSSSGTSNAVSRSLSRNFARNAAVLGGRSVSIAEIVNPACRDAKLGSQLFYPVARLHDAAESYVYAGIADHGWSQEELVVLRNVVTEEAA